MLDVKKNNIKTWTLCPDLTPVQQHSRDKPPSVSWVSGTKQNNCTSPPTVLEFYWPGAAFRARQKRCVCSTFFSVTAEWEVAPRGYTFPCSCQSCSTRPAQTCVRAAAPELSSGQIWRCQAEGEPRTARTRHKPGTHCSFKHWNVLIVAGGSLGAAGPPRSEAGQLWAQECGPKAEEQTSDQTRSTSDKLHNHQSCSR